MQPQGTALLNAAYFDQLTADINKIDACAQLQAVVNAAMATLQAEVNAIEAQIAALLPIITVPTSLGGVIDWISKFVAPQLKTYLNYIAQLEQTLEAIARLAQAAQAAADRLTHCSVTVPPIQVAPGVATPIVSVPLHP